MTKSPTRGVGWGGDVASERSGGAADAVASAQERFARRLVQLQRLQALRGAQMQALALKQQRARANEEATELQRQRELEAQRKVSEMRATLREQHWRMAEATHEQRRAELLQRQEDAQRRLRELEEQHRREARRTVVSKARDEMRQMRHGMAEHVAECRRAAFSDAMDRKMAQATARKEGAEVEALTKMMALRARKEGAEVEALTKMMALRARKDIRAQENLSREQRKEESRRRALERQIRGKAERVEALQAQRAAVLSEMNALRARLSMEEQALREKLERIEMGDPVEIDLTRMASAAWASASVTVPAFASPLGASLRPTTGRSARQGDKDGATRGSRRAASARAAVGGGAPDKARRAWMEEKQRELASLLRGERAREEERQRLMAQIRDVRERERIQSIFSVERKRAMDAIQDLVNTLNVSGENVGPQPSPLRLGPRVPG